jgi:hypothetical protein
MPILGARWLCGDALIHPSGEIIRLICDFNSLCSLGRSSFNIRVCLGATVTASLRPASAGYTGHRVRSRPPRHSVTTVVEFPINRPRRVPILWQTSGDSTLRLLSQPTWNDARGGILAYVLGLSYEVR